MTRARSALRALLLAGVAAVICAPAAGSAAPPGKPERALLGRAISPLEPDDPGSRINVKLAAERLTPLEVPPRAEFHFLAALAARGGPPRLPGRALLDGKVVTEEGGGLCQVSGTIYAAALRAGLGVVERSAHSAQVRTLPAGLDAAVSAEGGTDLVLWNPYRFPVRLDLAVSGGKLEARWTAATPGLDASVGRDSHGALIRKLSGGREELLEPAPPKPR